MENKFNIGDRVIWKDRIYIINKVLEDKKYKIDEYTGNYINVMFGDNVHISERGVSGVVEEELKLYIDEETEDEKETLRLNYASKYNELLIKHIDIKEENEELKERLDISKATIQMISELIKWL